MGVAPPPAPLVGGVTSIGQGAKGCDQTGVHAGLPRRDPEGPNAAHADGPCPETRCQAQPVASGSEHAAKGYPQVPLTSTRRGVGDMREYRPRDCLEVKTINGDGLDVSALGYPISYQHQMPLKTSKAEWD